ncbi:hypothetical protein HPB48_017818 [Haemaphysalis longicornis]|uniref:Uncharacterized protein n=1 Tax=Haemaphysalis longicornis TaxID=44386 RepID=A0A9J6GNH3_HAELO|nr:hypothetical protein HPB48_017818 [Haemaphysalis longicornis]
MSNVETDTSLTAGGPPRSSSGRSIPPGGPPPLPPTNPPSVAPSVPAPYPQSGAPISGPSPSGGPSGPQPGPHRGSVSLSEPQLGLVRWPPALGGARSPALPSRLTARPRRVSVGGSHWQLQLNRGFYRTPEGMMGIAEVLLSFIIVMALSSRGFIFDVFFFLCNLGFTYALMGAIFFLNGLLGSRRGQDLPLLVSVQYYGFGFITFLVTGMTGLVRSELEALPIITGILAVVMAITLLLHAVFLLRTP